ncbi:unnamed protein product [Cyclocybe aegerita]|uniref:Elongator complex protein 6 n=1 Tax=Cyclocybe aegerita TaxID=1973307 RepID=A0A8S0XVF0_CYCAE|nr:unnamed protein product [Cyclocybe aegerita]
MPSLFSPFDLPDDIILLLSDELVAPADFILHRTLAAHLKAGLVSGRVKPKSVILSVSEGLSRWKTLAMKSNINLQTHLDLGTLEFIELSSCAEPSAEANLRGVFDRVRMALENSRPSQQPHLIILDDVSVLEWIGFSPTSVQRFIRALRSLALKANATLVLRHHVVTPNEPDELLRHLLQICTYHLEVRPLASGRSGAVSGEVALHAGFSYPSNNINPVKLLSRSSALQYCLTEAGPEFFVKGTSGGVL